MLETGLHNLDCMIGMKEFPDKYFDLAIVDPPYGAGFTEGGGCQGWFSKYHQMPKTLGGGTPKGHYAFGIRKSRKTYEDWKNNELYKKIITWDVAPKKEFFDEVFRVSKNQIIWGGNYFELPPTRCFLVWRKLTINEKFSMAMCEYAWTSFNSNAKLFECAPQGKANDPRFHPTQKPVRLYEWILENYAKHGDKILDPMAGSGTCLIASRNMGYECTGFEIDEEYYAKAQKRIERESAQSNIFDFMDMEKRDATENK